MSGLGLFKNGKQGSISSSESLSFKASVKFEDMLADLKQDEVTAVDEDDDIGFENIGNDSVSSTHTPPPAFNELDMPADMVKNTMKLLKYAVKPGASENEVLSALYAIQKWANTTYAVRSDLGERGACEALALLFEKHVENEDIVVEVMKAISFMLLSDDENKVRMAKLGGCKLTIDAMKYHNEESNILELCCKLIVDFGNGKFVSMLEADFQKKEIERDLRSREMKRKTLSPDRIAAMTPKAAELARRALQELKEIEEEENEKERETSTSFAADAKDSEGGEIQVSQYKQDLKMWDNRLELCNSGACEVLVTLLQHSVKLPTAESELKTTPSFYSSSHVNLESIFEDEEVVIAACHAIASLAANSVCAKRFAQDMRLSRCLCALLGNTQHWSLMTAAAWAVLNLCADCKAGNKERLCNAGALQCLCNSLNELSVRHSEYLQTPGFHRLLEYLVWALLNIIVGCAHNQYVLQSLHREPLFVQLKTSLWTKVGLKDKLRQVLRLIPTTED